MQLIDGGPDIPDELINHLLNDQAVLFCGAGVSKNEGLPGFRSLAEDAITRLMPPDTVCNADLERERYESVFQTLEDRVLQVRLRDYLRNRLRFAEGAELKAHSCLLRLAQKRGGGKVRLVTTNFDKGFSRAAVSLGLVAETETAPKLPPVRDDWWSIVELHGALGEGGSDEVVLSSSQFGRAYMTEGWAARFVVELFRRFPVAFVGYSVDDPVIRYVVAAYRSSAAPQAGPHGPYAFAGSRREERGRELANWESKKVVPVWYETASGSHDRLWESLQRIGELKRSGAAATRLLLSRYCRGPVDGLSSGEKSQVLWALGEIKRRFDQTAFSAVRPDGPIRCLARTAPPAIEAWLGLLRESHLDLRCPIIGRWPRSYSEITSSGEESEHYAAAEWMARHLQSDQLIRWIVDEGGHLSPVCADRLRELLDDGLREPFRRAWVLICDISTDAHVWYPAPSGHLALHRSMNAEEKARSLIGITEPAIVLRPALHLARGEVVDSVDDLVEPEVDLPRFEHPKYLLNDLLTAESWPRVIDAAADGLLDRLDDLARLLDKIEGLVGAIPATIRFEHHLADNPDEIGTWAWRVIPLLALKALEALWAKSPVQVSERLRFLLLGKESLIHKRVALRYLIGNPCVPCQLVLESLVRSPTALLDDHVNRPNVLELLKIYGKQIRPRLRGAASDAIMSWCRNKCEENPARHEVWENEAVKLLQAIYHDSRRVTILHPELNKAASRIRERPKSPPRHLLEAGFGYLKGDDLLDLEPAELAARLRGDESIRHAFVQLTKSEGPAKAVQVLNLVSVGRLETEACLDGLVAWLERGREREAVPDDPRYGVAEFMTTTLERLGDDVLRTIAFVATRSLRAIASLRLGRLKMRLELLLERFLTLSLNEQGDPVEGRDPINDAINSTAFFLTEAGCANLPQVATPGADRMGQKIRGLLAGLLAAPGIPGARSSLALTFNLLWLFTLDPDWVRERLIPRLSSTEPNAARYAWAGFLWNPKFNPSLTAEIAPLVPTAISLLGDVEITRASLGALPVAIRHFFPEQYSADTLRQHLGQMKPPLLAEAIRAIVGLLPASSEVRLAWTGWVKDVLQEGLPSVRASYSDETSVALIELLIALEPVAEEAFPLVCPHIGATANFGYCIHRMNQGEPSFSSAHPRMALKVVHVATRIESPWNRSELAEFLNLIRDSNPALAEAVEYRDLAEKLESQDSGAVC